MRAEWEEGGARHGSRVAEDWWEGGGAASLPPPASLPPASLLLLPRPPPSEAGPGKIRPQTLPKFGPQLLAVETGPNWR